jgi:membrane-associated protein
MVGAYIDQFVGFAGSHAWLAYAAVFVAAVLEAVPVFGSFIPGSTIILALSGLAGSGSLDLVGVIAAAITGGLIGDNTAFFIGRSHSRTILTAWPMSRYPALVARSEALFERYGSLSVFFARFVPPVRAFVPALAGALGMSPLKFVALNVPSVTMWALAHILPGAFAVFAAEQRGGLPGLQGTSHLGWIGLVGLAALALAGWTWWRKSRTRSAEAATPGPPS